MVDEIRDNEWDNNRDKIDYLKFFLRNSTLSNDSSRNESQLRVMFEGKINKSMEKLDNDIVALDRKQKATTRKSKYHEEYVAQCTCCTDISTQI